MRIALLILTLARAPFQCASDPDPARRLEDSPSEALWDLAARFAAEGDVGARKTTLRQLIERYPSSAEAERARGVLAEDATVDAPDEAPTLARPIDS